MRIMGRLVLVAAGLAGAAAMVGAASLALFTSAATSGTDVLTSGTVTLQSRSALNCVIPTNLEPGDSTAGYPNGLGSEDVPPCVYAVVYHGSLPAWVALDASVQTQPGSNPAACGTTCAPLVAPSDPSSLNLLACGDQPPADLAGAALIAWAEQLCGELVPDPTAFGLGVDQTLTYPAAYDSPQKVYDVCTGLSSQPSACTSAEQGAVTDGWRYVVVVDFFLPATASNIYQGGGATVHLSLHAVQASDNPLLPCPTSTVNDPYGGGQQFSYLGRPYNNQPLNYPQPDQPENGWGNAPAAGTCPVLVPFFHPYT